MTQATKLRMDEDLLTGASEIAEYLFRNGNDRKVYYLAEKGLLPVFRVGSALCARKSTLQSWMEAQERTCSSWAADWPPSPGEPLP